MGFWGPGPYDNDFSGDWLCEHEHVASVDAMLDELAAETDGPAPIDAGEAALVVATAAALLHLAGVAGYDAPEPLPNLYASDVGARHWKRLQAVLARLPDSAIRFRTAESREDWQRTVDQIRADVDRLALG